MRKIIALSALLGLAACIDSEPTVEELDTAMETYLARELRAAMSSADMQLAFGLVGAFAGGSDGSFSTDDIKMQINNLRKLGCEKRSGDLYECEVLGDLEIDFGPQLSQFTALMGVPTTERGLTTVLVVEKQNGRWVVISERD